MELGKAVSMINKTMGNMDMEGVNTDRNDDTEHFVKHKYMEEIILPYIGITNNVAFMTSSGDKYITFVDGVRCKVMDFKEIHICSPQLDDDVKRLYNMDVWRFVNRWYKVYPHMSSMYFVYIKCEKKGGKDGI